MEFDKQWLVVCHSQTVLILARKKYDKYGFKTKFLNNNK